MVLQAVGFSSEKEQLAYALAEQAALAAWACLQAAAQRDAPAPARASMHGADSADAAGGANGGLPPEQARDGSPEALSEAEQQQAS